MSRVIERLREQRARHRERHALIRFGAVVAGFLLVVLGVILIPLPGPGVLVIAAGLFLLALEFAWAERLLTRTVHRLERTREVAETAGRLPKAIGALLLVAGVVTAVAVAVFWDVPLLPV